MIDPMKITHIASALSATVIDTVRKFGGDPTDAIMTAEMTAAMLLVECMKDDGADEENVALFAKHVADLIPVLRKMAA